MTLCKSHYQDFGKHYLDFDEMRVFIPSGSGGLLYEMHTFGDFESRPEANIEHSVIVLREPIERWISVVEFFRRKFFVESPMLRESMKYNVATFDDQRRFWNQDVSVLIEQMFSNELMYSIPHIMPQLQECKSFEFDAICTDYNSLYDKIIPKGNWQIDNIEHNIWTEKFENKLSDNDIDKLKFFYREDYETYKQLVV